MHAQFARDGVGLCSFYNSYVANCLTRKSAQMILRNHHGFTISAIKLCFM